MTDKNIKMILTTNDKEIELSLYNEEEITHPTLEDYTDFIMKIEGEKLNVKILMSDFERVKNKIKGIS